MKTHLPLQTMRHAPHDPLFCVGLWLLAAGLPVAALGQSDYATPYTFTTLAGLAGNPGSADGTNGAARFRNPEGVALDSAGNLYVADNGNGTIREVTPAGVVTTLAGTPFILGTNDGMGSAARFFYPQGVAVDTNGNVYVVDCANHTIRKVSPVGTNWVVTTLAGSAGTYGSADGTNDAARFYYPLGVALDNAGNLYVADARNYTIRKVTPIGTNWVVTTLAGLARVTGSADGTNSDARFSHPGGVAVDSSGNVYVTDGGSNTIRKLTPVGTNWVVTTLAGTAASTGSTDGTNGTALFSTPFGVAVDSAGSVYVTDEGNSTIRKLTPVGTNWVVTTLAGVAGQTGGADGTGSAALFNSPDYVAVDSLGNLYVSEFAYNTIRKGFPASSVPAPILESPGLIGGQFGFGIAGLPNLAVDIESSGDFSQWFVIGSSILEGGTNHFVNPAPFQGLQFYRGHVR